MDRLSEYVEWAVPAGGAIAACVVAGVGFLIAAAWLVL
jgi:hypothetical protein